MSESGVSVWTASGTLPTDDTLTRDAGCDVCVVGAGVAGLTTAYLLAEAGKRVVVLDAQEHAGGGETAYTTAHLTCVLDDRFHEVERIHGEDNLRLAVASHTAAIDRIEALAKAERIDCDFRRVDGYLFLPPGGDAGILDREADCANRAGLAFDWVPRAPLGRFDTGRCLRFPNQGQFHPLRYLKGVRDGFLRRGGALHGEAAVERIDGGSPCRVKVRGGPTVTADAVVVATNTPINDVVATHTKQAPYLTYVVGLAVAANSMTRALFWDTEDPYHYLRLQKLDDGHDLLMVGGADHKTGQKEDPQSCWTTLEAWARERFPMAGAVRYRWSGQVMETLDGLAFLGADPAGAANVYIATGDSGMGMTHGTIAGLLLRDLILGRANPWADLYDPSRKPVKAAGAFAKENLNVAGQYLDWATGGDVGSADEVKPGQGAVLRRGLTKVAAYRDEQGRLHECSAVCPHLGCLVRWNGAGQTWDCPCHGSRFSTEGKVLHGPAVADLEPVGGAVSAE